MKASLAMGLYPAGVVQAPHKALKNGYNHFSDGLAGVIPVYIAMRFKLCYNNRAMSGRRIFYPYPQHPPIETEREHVPVAQLDRALDSDSKGQRFESSRVRHVAVDSAIPIPQENLRDFPCSVPAPLPQKVTLASSEPLLARVLIADSLATNFLRLRLWMSSRLTFFHMDGTRRV